MQPPAPYSRASATAPTLIARRDARAQVLDALGGARADGHLLRVRIMVSVQPEQCPTGTAVVTMASIPRGSSRTLARIRRVRMVALTVRDRPTTSTVAFVIKVKSHRPTNNAASPRFLPAH